MNGLFGALARLVIMALVMAAVLVGAVFAGLAATTAIAIGIVATGVVGLISVARRPGTVPRSAHDQIAAMMAPPPVAATMPVARPSTRTAPDAMAPQAEDEVNPEAGMPRWRRPSLLEARHSEYTRITPTNRMPMRFGDDDSAEVDIRVVRHAVVPVLDRPDAVLGLRQSDLASGDEVQVVRSQGAFVEVLCPNGDSGWVHRSTLADRGGVGLSGSARMAMGQDADDALTALLTARGLV